MKSIDSTKHNGMLPYVERGSGAFDWRDTENHGTGHLRTSVTLPVLCAEQPLRMTMSSKSCNAQWNANSSTSIWIRFVPSHPSPMATLARRQHSELAVQGTPQGQPITKSTGASQRRC
jgi:hypothetical protein